MQLRRRSPNTRIIGFRPLVVSPRENRGAPSRRPRARLCVRVSVLVRAGPRFISGNQVCGPGGRSGPRLRGFQAPRYDPSPKPRTGILGAAPVARQGDAASPRSVPGRLGTGAHRGAGRGLPGVVGQCLASDRVISPHAELCPIHRSGASRGIRARLGLFLGPVLQSQADGRARLASRAGHGPIHCPAGIGEGQGTGPHRPSGGRGRHGTRTWICG
jgi:hypothetical protein